MHGTIAPVGKLLGVLQPRSGTALVAGVGAGTRVSATHRSGQRIGVDVAVPSAVADRLFTAGVNLRDTTFAVATVYGNAFQAASKGQYGDYARDVPTIVGRWPETAFLPERQCRGRYAVEELQPYLSRARLAMWLPGTRSITLDPARRCITVTVESVGGGRLAELVIRSMAVPRRAVLLILAGNPQRS